MTLRNSGKLKVFVCDGHGCTCQWGVRFHPSEIGIHARKMREDGWRMMKIKGKFQHFCPNCEPPGGFKQRGKKARKAQEQTRIDPPQRRWRADIDG